MMVEHGIVEVAMATAARPSRARPTLHLLDASKEPFLEAYRWVIYFCSHRHSWRSHHESSHTVDRWAQMVGLRRDRKNAGS